MREKIKIIMMANYEIGHENEKDKLLKCKGNGRGKNLCKANVICIVALGKMKSSHNDL